MNIDDKLLKEQYQQMTEIARRASRDQGFRKRLEEAPAQTLSESGLSQFDSQGLEVRVVFDNRSTRHIVMPANPNQNIEDEEIAHVAGGGSGTLGSAGSLGTAISCASSVSTVSSRHISPI